jgi:hypothetical protein
MLIQSISPKKQTRKIKCHRQSRFHATAPLTVSYDPYKLRDSHRFLLTTIIITNLNMPNFLFLFMLGLHNKILLAYIS